MKPVRESIAAHMDRAAGRDQRLFVVILDDDKVYGPYETWTAAVLASERLDGHVRPILKEFPHEDDPSADR